MSTDDNKFQRVDWSGDQPQPSDDDDDRGAELVGGRGSSGLSDADLELLTLAARAIGAVRVEIVDGEQWVNLHFADGSTIWNWNPLLHSDDAFDLQVALPLNVYRDNDLIDVHGVRDHQDVYATENVGDDLRAATRRAVTRAAAEIGKAIQ